MNLIIISCLCSCTFAAISAVDHDYMPRDWVDPTDLRNYDRYTKSMRTPELDSAAHAVASSKETKKVSQDEVNKFEIFLERFINRFLYSADLKDRVLKPDTKIVTEIPVLITTDELSRLMKLAERITSSQLTELDEILSAVLSNDRGFSFNLLTPYLNPVEQLFYHMSWEKIAIMTAVMTFGVVLWMFAVGKSLRRIMIFVYLIFFMGGLAANWWKMYQEAVAEKYAKMKSLSNIPDVCSPLRNTWWNFLFGSVDEECKQYHKAFQVEAFSQVSPSIVLSETVTMMFIHPLRALGSGLGDFLRGINGAAPFPLNLVFLPFVYITSLCALVCFGVTAMGKKLNFWTWFGGIDIGGRSEPSLNYTTVSDERSLKDVLEQSDGNELALVRVRAVRQYVRTSMEAVLPSLILAKYGASKLEIVKQLTQDAALDEFETRLSLKNRFSLLTDKFTDFMRNVFDRTMKYITDYICSPDWSILENGNNSLWILNNVIREEIHIASSLFTSASHTSCLASFYDVKNEIFSVIDSWSSAIDFSYSNFISATLSNIFVHRMKGLITKYEYAPQSTNIRWLYEDVVKYGPSNPSATICSESDSSLWFINCSFGLQYFDDNSVLDEFYFYTENELSQKLADWLFMECLNEFRATAERVLELENDGKYGARIYGKEKLSSLLDLPVSDLEFQLMMSEDHFRSDMNVADGPHYYVPVPDLTELQMFKQEDDDEMSAPHGEIKNGFDLLDRVFHDYGDTEMNNKISDIKVELNEFCAGDHLTSGCEDGGEMGGGGEDANRSAMNMFECDEVKPLPKLQIVGKHQAQANELAGPPVQQKKRGRPRKIDEYNHTSTKNGQHKYSQENVLDCSTWISDNFFEVAGNKPAIDRARLYELYTNYCLLKLCTPVDRALFGKIIRKVFPKLRSRRLIQNQVLKYHYVGLKPKFAELEQALLHSDSSMNPQEIVLSYIPVDSCT